MKTNSSDAARLRRTATTTAWALQRGSVLVSAGTPVPIAGTDQFHDFHAHGEHRYLAAIGAAGSVLAFDPADGWTLFAPVASSEERVWTGDLESLESLGSRSGIDRVAAIDELLSWLEERRGEPLALLGNPDISVTPALYGLDQWDSLELDVDTELSERLSQTVSELRRAKDPWEIDLMRRAAEATRRGHMVAMGVARAGMTERLLQVELEAEFFRSGADRTAYGSIVGSGPNGSVLHFEPTDRVLNEGEIVLIDAGAECEGYACDVTRTFPVGSRFSSIQRDLYSLVLHVQTEAIAAAVPGKEYRELHLQAAARVAEGLVQLGILKGQADSLVERDAHALFFPHGLGHMLGLATHDAGGCLAGREPSDRFGLKWLRADLPLRPGYVVTIEPGVYFIRAVLEDPEVRMRFAADVNWDLVDKLADFGGIRIEDDVLITEGAANVLTSAIPKTVIEIEALREAALR